MFLIPFLILFFSTLFFTCLYTIALDHVKHWYFLFGKTEKDDLYEKFSNRLFFTLSNFSFGNNTDIIPKSNTAKILVSIQYVYIALIFFKIVVN